MKLYCEYTISLILVLKVPSPWRFFVSLLLTHGISSHLTLIDRNRTCNLPLTLRLCGRSTVELQGVRRLSEATAITSTAFKRYRTVTRVIYSHSLNDCYVTSET